MKKSFRKLLWLGIGATLILLFQNCSDNKELAEEALFSSDSQMALEQSESTGSSIHIEESKRLDSLCSNCNDTNFQSKTAVGGITKINDGFENNNFASLWKYHVAAGTKGRIVSSPFKSGKYAFMMDTSGSGDYRDEIVPINRANELLVGKSYCIEFDLMAKDWSGALPTWLAFFQAHAVPSAWTCTAGQNTVSITGANGKIGVNANNTQETTTPTSKSAMASTVYTSDLKMNSWRNIIIHLKPSKDNTGFMSVWIDGQKVYSLLNKPNMDLKDLCGKNTQNLVVAKFGIYRQKENTGSQKAVFDNISIVENPTSCGGGSSGGSSTSPSGSCTVKGEWFSTCDGAKKVLSWSTCKTNPSSANCTEAKQAYDYCVKNSCF